MYLCGIHSIECCAVPDTERLDSTYSIYKMPTILQGWGSRPNFSMTLSPPCLASKLYEALIQLLLLAVMGSI